MLHKGSEWKKWDLHVHTPESVLYNKFDGDWDTYVQALFRKAISDGVGAIGVTDYFSIDGYKHLRQNYLDNKEKLKEILILKK